MVLHLHGAGVGVRGAVGAVVGTRFRGAGCGDGLVLHLYGAGVKWARAAFPSDSNLCMPTCVQCRNSTVATPSLASCLTNWLLRGRRWLQAACASPWGGTADDPASLSSKTPHCFYQGTRFASAEVPEPKIQKVYLRSAFNTLGLAPCCKPLCCFAQLCVFVA